MKIIKKHPKSSSDPCCNSLQLHAVDRDGFAFRLAGQGHNLAVSLLSDFVLIGDLVDLPLFGHQYKLVAISEASLDALDVGPHPLAPLGAHQVDDVARHAAARTRSRRDSLASSSRSGTASTTTTPTAAATRGFKVSQRLYAVDSSQTVQVGPNLIPIAL